MGAGLKVWLAGRWIRACAAAALLWGAASAALAGCISSLDSAEPWAALDAAVEHSRWQELDAQGHSLVRETGTLQVLGLSVGLDRGQAADHACQPLRWVLRLSHAQGRRDYQGVSSSQVPIQTASAIGRNMAQLLALQALTDAWSVAGRLSYRQTLRAMADSGPVLGYPERTTDWQAAATLRYGNQLGPGPGLGLAPGQGWRWSAEVWLGAGPRGSLLLRLPQADPASLVLGRSRLVQWGLVLESAEKDAAYADLSKGWSGQLRLDYLFEQFGSGESTVIRRQGLPIGGAAQPAARQSALSLQAALRYRF